MEKSTPLTLTEIATLVIVSYGLGEPKSKNNVKKMIHALETTGLTWTHFCKKHEDVIPHCSTCKKSGWSIQEPMTHDHSKPLEMTHIENYIDRNQEVNFHYEDDHNDIQTALQLLEQEDDRRLITKNVQKKFFLH